MNKGARILVLGGTGLVGSAILRELKRQNFSEILTPRRTELDLLNQQAVADYFSSAKPEFVFFAAAKVGGILANNTFRADFIQDNLTIQNNVFAAAFANNVEKLLFMGSSCIYPKLCPQPIKEEYLLTGPLEETNEPYAIAKIAGLKTVQAYRQQHGRKWFSVMPTNLYGPNDNFDPENSHVMPALIHRMDQTMKRGEKVFEVWGTGTPRREFLHVDDLAEACVLLMGTFEPRDGLDWLNIGTGVDITIADLAVKIAEIYGFKGDIVFNNDFPDGTPKKVLDVSKLNNFGWASKINLSQGLQKVVAEFRGRSN